MAAITINNIADARQAGSRYDVAFPVGAGRPPLRKLAQAIVAAGDTIDATDYFSADLAERAAVAAKPTGTRQYRVTVEIPRKDGKGMRKPVTVVYSLSEIREALGAVGRRGGVSRSRIIDAVARLTKALPDVPGDDWAVEVTPLADDAVDAPAVAEADTDTTADDTAVAA